MIASRHFTHHRAPSRVAAAPSASRALSSSDEGRIQAAADELEQLAEEIRNRGMRGHLWREILPQWNRLREIERSYRPAIEGAPEAAPMPAVGAETP